MQIKSSLHNVSFSNEGKSLQYNVGKSTANVAKKCDFQIVPKLARCRYLKLQQQPVRTKMTILFCPQYLYIFDRTFSIQTSLT